MEIDSFEKRERLKNIRDRRHIDCTQIQISAKNSVWTSDMARLTNDHPIAISVYVILCFSYKYAEKSSIVNNITGLYGQKLANAQETRVCQNTHGSNPVWTQICIIASIILTAYEASPVLLNLPSEQVNLKNEKPLLWPFAAMGRMSDRSYHLDDAPKKYRSKRKGR